MRNSPQLGSCTRPRSPLVVSLSNHEQTARPSTSSGRAKARRKLRVLAIVTLALVAVTSGVFVAQQADRTRTEALAQRAADRLRALQREADQLAAQERSLLTDLRKLEIDR